MEYGCFPRDPFVHPVRNDQWYDVWCRGLSPASEPFQVQKHAELAVSGWSVDICSSNAALGRSAAPKGAGMGNLNPTHSPDRFPAGFGRAKACINTSLRLIEKRRV